LTFGNSGRSSLNIPRRTQFDMSTYKTFKPTERVDVQFRADGFNAINHTQFFSLDSGVVTVVTTSPWVPMVLIKHEFWNFGLKMAV